MIDVEKLIKETMFEVYYPPRDRPSRLRIAVTFEEHMALREYCFERGLPFWNQLRGVFLIIEEDRPLLSFESPPIRS